MKRKKMEKMESVVVLQDSWDLDKTSLHHQSLAFKEQEASKKVNELASR